MLNIVLPIAGRGSRFAAAGYAEVRRSYGSALLPLYDSPTSTRSYGAA